MILKAKALNLEAKQTLCFFMFLTHRVIQFIHSDTDRFMKCYVM